MADAHIGLAGLCRLAQLGDGLGELRHGPPPGDLAALGQRRIYTALCLQCLDQQGQSLAAGLSGWLLQRIGYSTAAAQAGQPQPSQVLAGMFNISTLVPFFGFLALSLVLAFWYPLRKAQVEANVAALREKNGDA